MKKLFFIVLLFVLYNVNGQGDVKGQNPKPNIIVVPVLSAAEISKPPSELNGNMVIALTKVREEFTKRGYNTIDFLDGYNSALQELNKKPKNILPEELLTDIIRNSNAQIKIAVDLVVNSRGNQNSVNLVLDAADVAEGNLIQRRISSSGYFETTSIDALTKRALSNVIEDFTVGMHRRSAEIASEKTKVRYKNRIAYKVKRDGLVGLDDENGNEILPTKFEHISTRQFNDYTYTIYELKERDGRIKMGFLTQSFKYNDTLLFDDVVIVSYNCIAVKKNGLYGFIDSTDNQKLPFKFTNTIDKFSDQFLIPGNNLIKVVSKNKVGLINIDCNEIVPPKYDEIGYKTGSPMYSDFIPVMLNKKFGAINGIGNVLIEPVYDELRPSSEGNVLVKKGNLYGIINFNGKVIKPAVYQSILYFNGCYYVKYNNKYGLINYLGNDIISPSYDTIQVFSSDIYSVQKLNKIGLFSRDGRRIAEPIYQEIRNFESNIALVKMNSKWGSIDQNGKPVIAPKYDEPFVFVNGRAAVKKNGVELRINEQDEIVYNDFQDADFSSLKLSGYTMRYQIQKKFEDLFAEVNAKKLYGSILGVKVSPKEMIIERTNEIKRTVEGWLNGPMTKAQLTEFYSIQKNAAAASEFAMAIISESLKSSNTSSTGYGELIGGSNSRSSNSTTRNSSQACNMCKPYDSKGHYIKDYDAYKRIYSNGRYILRPGYKPCRTCHGTGNCKAYNTCSSSQEREGDYTCQICHGDRFEKCSTCKGSGVR